METPWARERVRWKPRVPGSGDRQEDGHETEETSALARFSRAAASVRAVVEHRKQPARTRCSRPPTILMDIRLPEEARILIGDALCSCADDLSVHWLLITLLGHFCKNHFQENPSPFLQCTKAKSEYRRCEERSASDTPRLGFVNVLQFAFRMIVFLSETFQAQMCQFK